MICTRRPFRTKKRYKKQILGSKDSFGKIFDITRKLDIVQPEELFIETMHIMEEVLENETFAFYSLSQKNGYGRLEAASPKSQGMYSASVRLSEYTLALETLEKAGMGKSGFYKRLSHVYGWYPERRQSGDVDLYSGGKKRTADFILYESVSDFMWSGRNITFYVLLNIRKPRNTRKYVENTRILKPEYFEKVWSFSILCVSRRWHPISF